MSVSLLTLSVTQACVEYFRGGGILHYKYVWKILSAFQTAADSLPAMTSVDVPELCRLTVVGDLHGQVRVCARLCVLFAVLRVCAFVCVWRYLLVYFVVCTRFRNVSAKYCLFLFSVLAACCGFL